MKEHLKNVLGFLRCIISKIGCFHWGVYIGKNVHIVNGKNIELGKNVKIRPNCDLFAGSKMVIKDNCDLGERNRLDGNIVIEESVLFGPDNYISSVDHRYSDLTKPIMYQGAYSPNKNGHSELRIGEGSWIGTHCAIIGDVHIGKHCVIGANSVVTKDIPDYCVAVGIPAKVVKQLNKSNGLS